MKNTLDIDGLLLDFMGCSPTANATLQHHILLSGGYSGAAVCLAWFDGMPPLVVKFSPLSAILREKAGRDGHYGRNDELRTLGVDHIGPEFNMDGTAFSEPWACLAYFYEGGSSYQETRQHLNFTAYVGLYIDGQVQEEAIAETFRNILYALNAHEESVKKQDPPFPLQKYLPDLDWDGGYQNIFGIVSSLLPANTGVKSLEGWFKGKLQKISIAPVHDSRMLHGDPWFSNVLVNKVKSEVSLIDFGSSQNGHIFQDIARFEVDLWFRSDGKIRAIDSSQRSQIISKAIRELIPEQIEDRNIPISSWRKVLISVCPHFSLPDALQMYNWFLLVECIKRLRWIKTDAEEKAESDALGLIDAILRIRSTLDELNLPIMNPIAGSLLQESLGLLDVYLPIRGRERDINWSRNERKKRSLREVGSGEDVLILAETANSYLSARGYFYDELRAALTAGARIRVIILDPEYGAEVLDSVSSVTGRDSTIFRRKVAESIDGYRFLKEQWPYQIELRTVLRLPTCTVLLLERGSFYEPYLPFSNSQRNTVLFDTFEMETVGPAGSHLSTLLRAHWEFIHGLTKELL